MKQILAQIKPYLRWFIWGGILFFLIKTIKDRFVEVAAVRIDAQGWLMLTLALIVTICAHVWSGWVWTWILAVFKQSLGVKEGIRVYLVTNIAKYSPGNIWHFYGRIAAVARKGGSRGAATLSVLLEPLLMAAAALLIGLVSSGLGWLETDFDARIVLLQIVSLVAVGVGIQPRILNPLMHRLSRSKNKADAIAAEAIELQGYPIIPFLGEMGFVIFRGIGFMLTFMALQSVTGQQIPQLLSAFSFAWLLGLIVPGAPGGLGVFEVTAYSLLDNSQFPTEIAAVGLYRLVSILAEAIAAGISFKRIRDQSNG
ncbi:MAG: lysylphosphatidylglycerol synthase domain-containing protein [Pleurocapsa sp. MO_192.B19]|nr:lysylphosphatidylglycerol synthase domain-containing protein [Pleurocapsa sp. MO_192.B19]